MRKGGRGMEGEEVRDERGSEGWRDGRTKRGNGGRREGTRAKPGNQLVYYICIHLFYWIMPRQALISTQKHKLSH